MSKARTTDKRGDAFAKLLAERRATAGTDAKGNPAPMSYRDLSSRTDGKISHQMIYFMENGQREPLRNPLLMRALAKALGNTTYEELMEAAGYGREAGPAGSLPLTEALAASELDEGQIAEVETFIAFVRDRDQARRGRGSRAR